MSVSEYLKENGYRNVAEWAMSSGYVYHDDTDLWHDEDGYLVDPYQQLLGAIESAMWNEYLREQSLS